jgi:hypothetical protein
VILAVVVSSPETSVATAEAPRQVAGYSNVMAGEAAVNKKDPAARDIAIERILFRLSLNSLNDSVIEKVAAVQNDPDCAHFKMTRECDSI